MVDRHDPSTVDIEATFLHETAKAVLFQIEGCEVWIPKSQLVCFSDHHLIKGDEIEITCSKWFADQNL